MSPHWPRTPVRCKNSLRPGVPTEPAQTPYQKAQQEWDRRMGAATIQAANWRFITFGLAGLLSFSTAGNIVPGGPAQGDSALHRNRQARSAELSRPD